MKYVRLYLHVSFTEASVLILEWEIGMRIPSDLFVSVDFTSQYWNNKLHMSKPLHPADMGETGEERLVMYAQMAHLVQQMIAPEKVDVKEITQIICRVSIWYRS